MRELSREKAKNRALFHVPKIPYEKNIITKSKKYQVFLIEKFPKIWEITHDILFPIIFGNFLLNLIAFYISFSIQAIIIRTI